LALLGLLLSLPAVAFCEEQAPGILVVGDSISAAYGMSLEEGWVALLATRLSDDHGAYSVVNASISGETSGGGLRRLPELLSKHSPSIVIIELGGNDGLRGYPVGQLRDNLAAMIRLTDQAGATALVLPMEIPPNFGKIYTDAFRASFLEATRGTNAVLADFPLHSVALDTSLMQADGIHPTAEAQPLILDSVWMSLERLL
jgi:acyl-CoA thioesterase-1